MVEENSDRKVSSNEKFVNKGLPAMLNEQAMELSFVRNRLETLQETVLRDVQKSMSSEIDEVMQELRKHQLQANEFRNFASRQIPQLNSNNLSTWSNRAKTTNDTSITEVSRPNERNIKYLTTNETTANDLSNELTKKYHTLPDKVFKTRESFLTALLEIDHMKTIYHIFYIIFLVFLFNNISYEHFVEGSVSFGLGTFKKGLRNIDKVAGIWVIQHVFVFSIFFAFRVWSYVRTKLDTHKTLQRFWSISCLLIYIITQLLFAYVPTKICLYLNLPFVTASVLLLETVRLLMKMHSFIRIVTPRVLEGKLKSEQAPVKQINIPAFNKYIYYLFAPTLLYRDEYPRTSTIRWKFVLSRFFEVVAVAFLYSYVYERHIKPNFGHFGMEEINPATVIIKIFDMIMPSAIIFLTGFYMVLHAWLNFTAELLRFGDRMFYQDWWTATNYEAFYRSWNVVVHDWLYEYIYKDFYIHIFKGSKNVSSLTVFTISALFHEYILGYALQVCFPVMFVFFGVVGVIMVFLTRYAPKNFGNIVVWFSLIYGSSSMISLYSIEYFARINCPKEFNSWKDYLVPHIWSCNFK